MNIGMIILSFFVLLIGIFLLTSVYLEVSYQKNELNQAAEICIKYLFIKKRLVPQEKKQKMEPETEDKKEKKKKGGFEYYKNTLEKAVNVFDAIKDDVIDLLEYCADKYIVFKRLDFDFILGLDEPMYTGMASGLAYGVIYNILGVIHNISHIEKCSVNITPDFDRICHSIRADCILRLKNVHIIVIIVKIVKIYFKLMKVRKI